MLIESRKDVGAKKSLLYHGAQQKQDGDSIENQKKQQAEVSKLNRDVARLAEKDTLFKC